LNPAFLERCKLKRRILVAGLAVSRARILHKVRIIGRPPFHLNRPELKWFMAPRLCGTGKSEFAMPDEERARLVAEYCRAALLYTRSISSLRRNNAGTPDYQKLRAIVNDARMKCEEAHLAFERYMADHGRQAKASTASA
jgi:hypothetical protein